MILIRLRNHVDGDATIAEFEAEVVPRQGELISVSPLPHVNLAFRTHGIWRVIDVMYEVAQPGSVHVRDRAKADKRNYFYGLLDTVDVLVQPDRGPFWPDRRPWMPSEDVE